MSVVVQKSQVGDVSIFELSGQITLGEGSTILKRAVREALDESRTKLILDMGEVTYADSSGFGDIVSCALLTGQLDNDDIDTLKKTIDKWQQVKDEVEKYFPTGSTVPNH